MLTLQNTEAIRRIEEAIGYTFNDKRLLIQVLTRKTYLKIDPEAPDNEVLEFYGDTLMNYHVTNYFMSKYAHMLDDGLFFMRTVEQFTDMRSHYVCNRYLTDRIKAMGLARYLRAQNRESELRRDSEKAYADIFESLVGAIYLDSYQNDTLIRAFILRQLGIEPKCLPADIEAFDYDSLTAAPPAPSEATPIALEEPETIVDLPAEEVPVVEDASAPVQSVETVEAAPAETVTPAPKVEVPVAEAVESAEAAELSAEAPVEENTPTEAVSPLPVPVAETVTAVTVVKTKQEALADFCRQWGFDQPTYSETPPNAPNARPVAACTMKYKDAKGKLVKISLNDSGRTLAEATEKAAAKMLKKLEKQRADAIIKERNAAEKPVADKPAEAPVPEIREEAPMVSAEAVTEAVVPETPVAEAPAVEAPAAETEEIPQAVEAESEAVFADGTEETAESKTAEAEISDAEAVAVEVATEPADTPKQDAAEQPVDEAMPFVDMPVKQTFEYVEEVSVPEPVQEEFIQQTMILTMEDIPTEASDPTAEPVVSEDVKPAKNLRKKKPVTTGEESEEAKPKPKRSSSKKKTAPAEDKPAEEGSAAENTAETSGEASAETTAEATAEKSVKEAKPRARKPRTKKSAESDGNGTPAEGKQEETE